MSKLKKFKVEYIEIVTHTVEVEAQNRESAINKVYRTHPEIESGDVQACSELLDVKFCKSSKRRT